MALRLIEAKKKASSGELFHHCPLVGTTIDRHWCANCEHLEKVEVLQKSYRVHCDLPLSSSLLQPEIARAWDSYAGTKGVSLLKRLDHSWVEPKLDGVRAIVHCTPNRVFITTRRRDREGAYSQIQDNVPHLRDDPFLVGIGKTGYRIFDSELMVPDMDESALTRTMGIVGSLPERAVRLQESGKLVLHVFDMIPKRGAGSNLIQRRGIMEDLFVNSRSQSIVLVPYVLATSVSEMRKEYRRCLDAGYEGVVLKNPLALYSDTKAWLKVKEKVTIDAQVTGWEYGAVGSKYEDTVGALRVSCLRRGKLVEIARVSPGTDQERDAMYHTLRGLSPKKIRNLALIVEMEAQKWTVGEHPRLRHPRILQYRHDLSQPNELEVL